MPSSRLSRIEPWILAFRKSIHPKYVFSDIGELDLILTLILYNYLLDLMRSFHLQPHYLEHCITHFFA